MVATRLAKLEHRLGLLLSAHEDAKWEQAQALKDVIDLGRNIAMTRREIHNEREKSERNQLLPTTITVGNSAALASVNGSWADAPTRSEPTPSVEEEEKPQSEPSSTQIAALEQGLRIKVPCFFCGRDDREIAQIIPMPNLADTIKRVPVCEECWQKERRKRYPNAPKSAFINKHDCHCAACLAANQRRLRDLDRDQH
jgi:hypothetical protein